MLGSGAQTTKDAMDTTTNHVVETATTEGSGAQTTKDLIYTTTKKAVESERTEGIEDNTKSNLCFMHQTWGVVEYYAFY